MIWFVRHGETVWNVENKICGATDSPLTERGHQQAIDMAAARYRDFLARTERARTLFLDLGSGWNTPGIFKLPFWQMTLSRPAARYAWLDTSPDTLPDALVPRSLHLRADIGATLAALREERR